MGRSLPSAQILGSGLRGRPQRLSGDRVVPSEGLVQMRARLLRAPRLPGPQGPSASPTHPPPTATARGPAALTAQGPDLPNV